MIKTKFEFYRKKGNGYGQKITFKAKKDTYWEDWEHLRLVFSRGNVYPGTLHKDGSVAAEPPYYEGVSDYIDIDSIEII
ncbi:hypothetical protein ACFQ8U_21390 [Bacillus mobilis]|uniref:hypothetical protein n=1 Tax=Bacillus mobilis TaxID=2026190 RepID=UPI003673164C